jgi:hypothetical protein
MSDYVGPTFVKVEHLRDGPRIETIADVKIGSYNRPEAVFASGDVLSLNQTNIRKLIESYGEDSRGWAGCQIELRIGPVRYEGQDIEAILVRPVTPSKEKTPSTAPAAAAAAKNDLDDEIPF